MSADKQQPFRRQPTIAMPPRDMLPKAVLPAYDAHAEAYEKWAEVSVRLADLEGELSNADAADARLILDAARAGTDDLDGIGSPNRDRVEAEHRRIPQQEAALLAVAQDRLRTLTVALKEHAAQTAAEHEQVTAGYGREVTEAVGAFLQARRRYRWSRDRLAWWSAVAAGNPAPWPPPMTNGADPDDQALTWALAELRGAVLADTRADAQAFG